MSDAIKRFTEINVPGYFHFFKKGGYQEMQNDTCDVYSIWSGHAVLECVSCVFPLRQSLSVFVVSGR